MLDDPFCIALSRFLARDPAAMLEAPAILIPVLRRIAAEVASDLRNAALLDDVVSTVFELLLRPTVRAFDPTRGTATQYLYGYVLRAAEEVRSRHGAAGAKKQDLRRGLRRDCPLDLSHAPSVRAVEDFMAVIDSMLDLSRSTVGEPAPLRRAVWLIAEQDATLTAVAEAIGWDRTTLRRRLRVWAINSAGLSA